MDYWCPIPLEIYSTLYVLIYLPVGMKTNQTARIRQPNAAR